MPHRRGSIRRLVPSVLFALLALPILPAFVSAGPQATPAAQAELVRQIKRLQIQLLMNERWSSEHAGIPLAGPDEEAGAGDPCADCHGGGEGLSQRPDPWRPESVAPAPGWRLP